MVYSFITNASRLVVLSACVAVATPRDAWTASRVVESRDEGRTVLVEFDEGSAIRLNQPLVVLDDHRKVGRIVVVGMSSKGRSGKARLAEGVAPSGAQLLTIPEFKALVESTSVRPASRSGSWMLQAQGGFGLEMGSDLLQTGMGVALSLMSRDRRNSGWEIRVANVSSGVRGDVTTQTNFGPLTQTYDEALTIRPLTFGWNWHLGSGISFGAAAGVAQFSGASGGSSFYPVGATGISYELPVAESLLFTAGLRPSYILTSGNALFSKAILVESGVGIGLKF